MSETTEYKPRSRNAAILDRAFALVNSVPYQVSARWVFYRLLQEGFYSKKDDYKNQLLPALSDARHAFYKDWRPDTLADDTRAAVERGKGFSDERAWLQALAEGVKCNLDYWNGQHYYVECWYEARAMTDQFKYYTDYVTLRPMGGQPSIPYKWQTAKELERAAERYNVPVVVLYFGDLDRAGSIISDTVETDVRKWCDVGFDLIRAGLTAAQVTRYNVPENIEKPGDYQWEALSDEGARAIITEHVDQFVSHDYFSMTADREGAITRWARTKLAGIADSWN